MLHEFLDHTAKVVSSVLPARCAYDLEHVALFNGIRTDRLVNNGDYVVRSTQIGLIGEFSCYTGRQVSD